MRHAYRKDPGRDGMCTCGQGRSQDVHNMLVWRKAPSGNWVADVRDGNIYRCRPSNPHGRSGKASVWWPEFASLDELRQSERGENWTRIGSEVGTSLVNAKTACEQHRETAETA